MLLSFQNMRFPATVGVVIAATLLLLPPGANGCGGGANPCCGRWLCRKPYGLFVYKQGVSCYRVNACPCPTRRLGEAPEVVLTKQEKEENSLRELACNRYNPLLCVDSQLKPGTGLLAGQAICWGSESNQHDHEDPTSGALEFGLDEDGTLVYYDHHNHDPEIVVYKPGVKGEALLLTDESELILIDSDGNTVWQAGGCQGGNSKLKIGQDGKVELTHGNDLSWSVELDGTVTDACV